MQNGKGNRKETESCQGVRLGARRLSRQEAELILPTYPQIEKQVERFRGERIGGQEGADIQKTNNISIIGGRGMGKTSLLKTIREELIYKNRNRTDKDIILPILVPENMSESGTLMASVLGMLKTVVEEYVRETETAYGADCVRGCVRKPDLRNCYEEVVKQYVFIQKEYRSILIREFVTENDYARSSAKVFNSDVEYLNKFNELIRMLVNETDRLVFLFVDDIDLSTRRCTDVTKTLFSYLANENIVTFISGDMTAFEEGLTLEFLRQEELLDSNLANLPDFFGGREKGTWIDNKRQLAYECLKKVIPPAYRHTIKIWSPEEKGLYSVSEADAGKTENRKTLSELLRTALEDWIDPAFFGYEKEGTTDRGVMPYTYYLFDDTSRGLNNVYLVLDEISRRRNSEQGNFLTDKKRLLDTIIASGKVFQQYKDAIQTGFFYVNEGGDVKVFFENAKEFIYGEQMKKPEERFCLFLLVDFAARILYEKEAYQKIRETDEEYKSLKKKAMADLYFHSKTAGRIGRDSKQPDGWEKEKTDDGSRTVYDIHKSFLLKGDLCLNLAYYKELSLEDMKALDSGAAENKDISRERMDRIFLAFWNAVSLTASLNRQAVPEKMAEIYPVFFQEFALIQNQLSTDSIQNKVAEWFEGLCDKAITESKEEENKGKETKEKETLFLKRVLWNTAAKFISDELSSNDAKDILKSRTKEKKRKAEMIQRIDEKGLWKELPDREAVAEYLEQEIENEFKNIISDWEAEPSEEAEEKPSGEVAEKQKQSGKAEGKWVISTEKCGNRWQEFMDGKDGKSRKFQTNYKKSKIEIRGIVCPESKESDSENLPELPNTLPFTSYMKVVRELLKLSSKKRSRYGKAETQNLLNVFGEFFAEVSEVEAPYLKFVSWYYFRYRQACREQEEDRRYEELGALRTALEKAHETADEQAFNPFMDKLNDELPENQQYSRDEFRELFDTEK